MEATKTVEIWKVPCAECGYQMEVVKGKRFPRHDQMVLDMNGDGEVLLMKTGRCNGSGKAVTLALV